VANTADFYIIAPKNSGASLNAQEVVCAVASGTPPAINDGDSTTIGGTSGIAGVAAVNGLSILYPAVGGVMSKSGNWKGTASASGTAGWFRILCTPNYDAGTTTLATTGDDAYRIMRIDGNVSTSGADMLVSSAVITSGIEQAVTSFSFTVPAA
jgi:hypothetical protein